MREEEVAVLIIFVGRDIELGRLRSTLAAHRLCLTVLLRHESSGSEFAELQFGLDTEQGRTTMNER